MIRPRKVALEEFYLKCLLFRNDSFPSSSSNTFHIKMPCLFLLHLCKNPKKLNYPKPLLKRLQKTTPQQNPPKKPLKGKKQQPKESKNEPKNGAFGTQKRRLPSAVEEELFGQMDEHQEQKGTVSFTFLVSFFPNSLKGLGFFQ